MHRHNNTFVLHQPHCFIRVEPTLIKMQLLQDYFATRTALYLPVYSILFSGNVCRYRAKILKAVKKFSFYLCGNSAIIKVFAYKLPGHQNLQCASFLLRTWKFGIKVTLTSQLIWTLWHRIFCVWLSMYVIDVERSYTEWSSANISFL